MVASPGSKSSDKPRFRQDLVAEPIEDGATRFIDVADPDTGSLFRFYEVEYSLACAMDGERDVAGIVQWAKEELGLSPSPKEVQIVISTLRDLGYLESGAAAAAAAMPASAAQEAPKAAVVPQGVKPAAKPAVNKWDQPTQMGDADEYLEPGVVVPSASARPRGGDDLELGHAGSSAPKVETDLPNAADVELGAPGAAAAPANRPPVPRTAEVELGSPGRADVSVDLADHMAVGAEDVKAAVRASQVMKAVDVPKELLDAAEPAVVATAASKKADVKADKAEAKAEKAEAKADKAEAKAEKKAETKAERKADKAEAKAGKAEAKAADAKADAKAAGAKAVEARADANKPAAKADKKTDKKPESRADAKGKPAVEAPKQAEKRPVAPPAPKSGTSPLLIAMLVIVVLAAGAFLAYRYVFKKADTTAQTTTPPATEIKQPEPPPPPPVETVKLATEQQDPVELKAMSAGLLETIVNGDSAVKAGDAVAVLAGHKGIEAELAAMQKDIDARVKPELDKAEKDRDAAQTAGNKAAVTAAEARIADRKKSLDDKQAKLAAKKAELAKLQIKAPADGKVSVVGKAGAKVAAGDVVAKLARSPVLAGTFKTASGVTPQSRVLLATKDGGQKLSCTVVTADASGIKVACPGDAAPEGTEVTFVGADPNAPAGQGSAEIEMTDEGSAAAGSAAAGSAGAATGSAAPSAPAGSAASAGSAAPAVVPPTPPPPAKAPARAPAKAPAHVPAKAPAKAPVDKPADKPAEPADKPADKPAEPPAPAPAPTAPAGDTLK